MTYKQYAVIIVACALGFMGLSWDAIFFLTMILGNGEATICEPNTALIWGEFITLTLASIFVAIVAIKQISGTKKGIWKTKEGK